MPPNPFPGTPQDLDPSHLPGTLPVHVCLRNGFDPALLYQLVYPAQNAYLLGVGIAAFRDVNSFFRYAASDDLGNANPVANKVRWAVIRGVSQSGNFTRQFIHQGFNQDEANRIVHDGAWPIIAGRRVAANVRWGRRRAQPSDAEHPRSVQRDRHVSEDRRALRQLGSVRAEDDD